MNAVETPAARTARPPLDQRLAVWIETGNAIMAKTPHAVVMGTNGRTGMDRLLLGSVAERVIQTTELPVMTVKTPTDDE